MPVIAHPPGVERERWRLPCRVAEGHEPPARVADHVMVMVGAVGELRLVAREPVTDLDARKPVSVWTLVNANKKS